MHRVSRSGFSSALRATLAVLLLVAASEQAYAVPAFTFTGGTSTTLFTDRTFGYNFFTGGDPFTITSLGFWDEGGDGLAESHEVAVWDASGSTILAQAVVPAGTAGFLDSGFRFVAISPVVLAANTEFLAGAFLGSEAVIRFTTATEHLGLTLGSTRFDVSGTGLFAPPVGTQGDFYDDGYFGPNLNGEAAVPEPSTLLLLGGGLLAASRRLRAKRR